MDVVAGRQKFDLGLEREASSTCALHMKTENKKQKQKQNQKSTFWDKDSHTCAMCIGKNPENWNKKIKSSIVNKDMFH